MLYPLLICAVTVRFLVIDARVSLNSTTASRHSLKPDEACLKDIKARVIFNPETKMVDIQLTWSVKISYIARVTGFQIFYITNSGKSRSSSLPKTQRSYLIELPRAISKPENYTVFINCMPFVNRKSVSIGGKGLFCTTFLKLNVASFPDICTAFSHFNVTAPFHCLETLGITGIRKCKDSNIKISWHNPNVTGFRGYLVRVARVSCIQEEEDCCRLANYKEWDQLHKFPCDVTITDIKEESQYCIEILMCPADSESNLNCELKHSPIFISCLEEKRNTLFIISCYALVTVALVITCLLLWRFEKRRGKISRKMKALKHGLNETKNEMVCLKESNKQDPMLFIAYCAGCIAVENYVLHLTQFFRLNGIHAVSELTQETSIINHGRGVFLNKMLSEADFILVLCTDAGDDIKLHKSYTYTLNAIQNKVVEHGENLSQYFMVHFNQIGNVPDILRPASIDISEGHKPALKKMIRRIFGFLSYYIDEIAIQKNEIHLSEKALAKADELTGIGSQITASKHLRCLKKSCQKGRK